MQLNNLMTSKDNIINELKREINWRDEKIDKLQNLLVEQRTLGLSPGDTIKQMKKALVATLDRSDDDQFQNLQCILSKQNNLNADFNDALN